MNKIHVFLCGLLFSIISLAVIIPCNAQNFNKAKERPFVKIPFMKTPKIDGNIEVEEWETLKLNGLIGRNKELENRLVNFWVGCDKKKLYIAMQSEVHPEHGILTRSKPIGEEDISQVLMEDSIEIWVDPVTNNPAMKDKGNFFRLCLNANGAVDDMSLSGKDANINKKWRGKYEIASSIDKGIWNLEMAIDLKAMGITESSFDFPWGLRVCRNWKMPWVQGLWNPNTMQFVDPKTMPLIQFSEDAPVVQQLSYQNAEKTATEMKVRLKNPGSKPVVMTVSLGHNEIDQPRYYHQEKVNLAPGKQKIVEYKLSAADPASYQGISEIKIKSADGSICFLRDYAWRMRPKGKVWDVTGAKKTAVFDMGYYPYQKKLKIRVDVSSVDFKKDLEGLVVRLTPHDSKHVLVEKEFPASPESDIIEKIIEVPKLKDGSYDVKIDFKVKGKELGRPMVETFERNHFPWENNQLGISDEVIPPFTPIEVQGKTVKTILREHQMSPMGLWTQVNSKGQQLLAAPIEFQITRDGKSLPIKSKELKFTTEKPNQLKGYADWECGKLQGKTEFEYDYDGMMKVTLELKPEGTVKIDRFRMVIPLKEPYFPLMHVIADGIRMTESKGVPVGKGIVWRSLNVNRNFIRAPFVPYIWLGGPERGICWFADTDKGWILDRKKDSAVIERRDKVISLVIDFINTPTEFSKPMKVVFGLQATPVKPMPENWRQWGGTKHHPFKWMWFGAEAYWSGANVALWPYKKDFTILDKYREARKTGKKDLPFFEKLYKDFDYHEWYKPADKAAEHFRRHISAGYNKISSFKPQALTTYTNATGALMCTPEWWTFQDEWTFEAYRLRDARTDKREILKWNETRTNLSKSRTDFMLWQYKKLMKALMDGIYWDNMYPHAMMDKMNGPAYKLPNGRIQPCVNIFALRELVKRTAVLAHQMGKPRCNMVHMTTASLVPVYSFADMTLDWEWKYGMDDFQERFPVEYILTESTGLQTGCIPFVLTGIRGDATEERKKFVRRTCLGWTLVHELKTDSLESPEFKVLYDFGYGSPDCQVYNWWAPKPKVKIAGVDAKYLLLEKDSRLLLVICSFGKSGKATVSFLGQPGKIAEKCSQALDVGSKQVIPVNGGTFSFELPKHDYRIFILDK